jgi:hypothetical protein
MVRETPCGDRGIPGHQPGANCADRLGKSRQALGITSQSDDFDVLLLVVAFQERGIRGAGLAGQ